MVVDLEPAGRLARPVTLAEIKALPAFADSPLVRQGRLSVVPLTAAQWKADRVGSGRGVSDRLVVLSTVGKAEDAERIARALVERGLAACVNVVPGVRLDLPLEGRGGAGRGAPARDQDARRARSRRCSEALVALHPYEVPEVLALPDRGRPRPYLDWLDESVARGEAGDG